MSYSSLNFDQVRTAIADFSAHSQDSKAAIVPIYASNAEGQAIYQNYFYDGPTPPPGVFDNFTNIPSVSGDLKTRSYLDMILTTEITSTAGLR